MCIRDSLNYLTSIGVTKLVEPPDANGKDLWIDAVFGNNQSRKVDDKLIKLFSDKSHNKNSINPEFFSICIRWLY